MRERFNAMAERYGWSTESLAVMSAKANGLPLPASLEATADAATPAPSAASSSQTLYLAAPSLGCPDSEASDIVTAPRRGLGVVDAASEASPASPAVPRIGRALVIRAAVPHDGGDENGNARRKSGMRRRAIFEDASSSSDDAGPQAVLGTNSDSDDEKAPADAQDADESDDDIALADIRKRVLATPAVTEAASDADDDDDDDFLVPDDVEDAICDDEEDENEDDSASISSGSSYPEAETDASPEARPATGTASVRRMLRRVVVSDSEDEACVTKPTSTLHEPAAAASADSDCDDFVDGPAPRGGRYSFASDDAAENDAPPAPTAPRTGKAAGTKGPGTGASLCDGDIDPVSGLVIIVAEKATGRSVAGAGARGGFRNRRHRDAMTAALFREYNSRVFGDALPSGTPVEWGARLTKTAGLTYTSRERAASLASAVSGAAATERRHALERSQSEFELVAECASAAMDSGAGVGVGRPSLSRAKAGCTYRARIVLSSKVLDTPSKLAQTLLHEMCHAAAWIVDGVNRPPHGAVFSKWARAASSCYPCRAVTTCHSYEIAYKFHYTCLDCGFIYGRHSRSIDTDAVRCGRCGRGRLVLSTTGSVAPAANGAAMAAASAPAPPRTPSAYQAFVAKDRLAVLSAMPGATPQRVMAESAKRWRAHKEAVAAAAAISAAAAGV